MAFTPQAKAEKALKELQKLPANKRCADCSGNGSLVRFPFPRPGLFGRLAAPRWLTPSAAARLRRRRRSTCA